MENTLQARMGSDGTSDEGGSDEPSRNGGGDQSRDSGDVGSGSAEGGFSEFESYYELLGVSEGATTGEIERAYRELAKKHHPDASNRPERVAERRFRQLLTAREVLTSVERRRAYDELGHEEYRRQSESLGEPPVEGDLGREDNTERAPEPRPGPGGQGDQQGQVQRSARGKAHRRGDPVVTGVDEAFDGPAGSTPPGETAETAADTGAQSIYRLVSGSAPESRSLGYVAARWARSWRNRIAVGVVSVLLAVAGLTVLSVGADAAGVDLSVPAVTPGRVLGVALVTVVAHTGYSGVVTETQLPRGQFLADRDHGRFSAATSRTYQRRGLAALGAVFVLAGTSARNGVDPWVHTADVLRGDLSGPFPWFDVSDAAWTGALDVVLSGIFAVAAVAGTLLLMTGASISLWRGRYERGLRVRPSLWEPVLVAALVSVPFALAAGPTGVVSVGALSLLPETVVRAGGVDGSTVTTATVATVGIVLSVVSVALFRARAALAGVNAGGQAADDPDSG